MALTPEEEKELNELENEEKQERDYLNYLNRARNALNPNPVPNLSKEDLNALSEKVRNIPITSISVPEVTPLGKALDLNLRSSDVNFIPPTPNQFDKIQNSDVFKQKIRELKENKKDTLNSYSDPDLRGLKAVEPPKDEESYGYKEAKDTFKKAQELYENEDYIKSLQPEIKKTPKPNYEELLGERGGKVAEFISDKISPVFAKDEDEEDYSPVNLTQTADAPLRALRVVDNVTGRPLRRQIYETLGGEPKKEVEGSDIREQLETKTGKLPKIIGKPVELASDWLLDWGNVASLGALPIVKKALPKVLKTAATKFATNPNVAEHLATIAANKAKNATNLENVVEAERILRDTGKPASTIPTREEIKEMLEGTPAEKAVAREAFKSEFNLPLAHGTSLEKTSGKAIEEFKPSTKDSSPMFGEGIYTGHRIPNSLESGWNEDYAKGFGSHNVPLVARGSKVINPYDDDIYESLPHLKGIVPTNSKILEKLSKVSGISIDKLRDSIPSELEKLARLYPEHFEGMLTGAGVKMFEPKSVRLPWAKFDPSMSGSGNTLAGLAGAALLGGTALSSDKANASEMPSKDSILKTLRGE